MIVFTNVTVICLLSTVCRPTEGVIYLLSTCPIVYMGHLHLSYLKDLSCQRFAFSWFYVDKMTLVALVNDFLQGLCGEHND